MTAIYRNHTIDLDRLGRLSGMAYHEGKTPDHWETLVGVHPAEFPELITIRNGLCYWTPTAERLCQSKWEHIHSNFAALGIACS